MFAHNRYSVAGRAFESFRSNIERVADPTHIQAQQLIRFWRECEAAGGFLVGRDVPSRPLMKILNSLVLFEPVEQRGELIDLRARLAGDGLRVRFDRDITGLLMSELFLGSEFTERLRYAADALRDNDAIVLRVELGVGAFVQWRSEIVLLPVWNSQRTARWLLAGLFRFP